MRAIKIKKEGNSTLIGGFVPVGFRDEPNNLKGISHFLEHMLFKGTKNRSKGDIKREIEQYGGYFNAWTSEEHTFYYTEIANRYKDVARDVITDMLKNSLIPDEEVEKERQVIYQEIDMYDDNPTENVMQLISRLRFDEHSGLHLPGIGSKESLKDMTAQTLREWYEINYKDPIMIEIGDVDEEQRDLIELNKPTFNELSRPFEETFISKEGITQSHIVFTGLFNMENYNDLHIAILSSLLNNFTGRLFEVIREQNNMCYHVSFHTEKHRGGDVQYYVYVGLDEAQIPKAKELIKQELTRPFTKEEVEFAVKKFIGKHQLSLDSNSTIARIIIHSTMNDTNFNQIIDDYDIVEVINDEVINGLVKHIDFSKGQIVGITPKKDTK